MKDRVLRHTVLLLFAGLHVAFGQSKIILSSRFFHPSNASDTLSTVSVIDQLKPDRLDWIYTVKPEQLQLYKDRNIAYSIAMNPQIPDSAGFTSIKTRIVDINKRPYVAPWMKGWKINNPYWGCVNNPEFKKLFYKRALQIADLGAYAIFVDDALFNVQLQKENKYGCFCKYCLEGFTKYLLRHNHRGAFSPEKIVTEINARKLSITNRNLLNLYKKYQEESVVEFLNEWKKAVKEVKPQMLFLTNNYKGQWNNIYRVFDGGIAELPEEKLNIEYLDSLYKLADKFHKTQVFTLVSLKPEAQDYLMAYCYLKGRDFLIPWDIFVPTNANSSNRYYGNIANIKELILLFKKRSLLIEVSNEPISADKKNTYYKIERRNAINVFLLNKDPLKSER